MEPGVMVPVGKVKEGPCIGGSCYGKITVFWVREQISLKTRILREILG